MTVSGVGNNTSLSLNFTFVPRVLGDNLSRTLSFRVIDITDREENLQVTSLESYFFSDLSQHDPDHKWDKRLVIDVTEIPVTEERTFEVVTNGQVFMAAVRVKNVERVDNYMVEFFTKEQLQDNYFHFVGGANPYSVVFQRSSRDELLPQNLFMCTRVAPLQMKRVEIKLFQISRFR